MAIAVRSSASEVVNGSNPDLTWPTTAAGDIAIAFLVSDADTGFGDDTVSVTAPADWVEIVDWIENATNRPRVTAFYYDPNGDDSGCTGTETGATGEFDGGSNNTASYQSLSIVVYSGALVPTTIGTVNDGYSTSQLTNGITTVADESWALAFVGTKGNPATFAPPAGFTEQIDLASAADYRTQSVATKLISTAGATGDATFTSTTSSVNWATFMLELPVAGLTIEPAALDASATFPAPTFAQSQSIGVLWHFSTAAGDVWQDRWLDVWGGAYEATAFYAPTLTLGAVTISPALLDASAAFYGPAPAAAPNIAPFALDASPVLYEPVLTVGGSPQQISPAGLDAGPSFPAPTSVGIGVQTLSPATLEVSAVGAYQLGYGYGYGSYLNAWVPTLTVGAAPETGPWEFQTPDSATVKSPTLTAEFRRDTKYSIMHHRAPKPRAVHVLKTGAAYTEHDVLDTDQIAAADAVYLGGRTYTITDAAEKSALEAAGYTLTPA